MNEIPASELVVDLADLREGGEKQNTAEQTLRRALGDFGLVYVKGHGLDLGKLESLYERFIEFTERTDSQKGEVSRPDIWYQRGWTPANTEKAVVAGGQPDFKECYFAAPMPISERARMFFPEIYADNVWPPGFDKDAFENPYMALGNAVHEVGKSLLRGCANAAGLETETFTDMIEGGPHVTRLLRYLALKEEQVGTDILWGEEHTDFNLLTLLPGGRFYDPSGVRCARPDDTAGLYLRARATDEHPEGQMVYGRAPEGCIVAQVGQQLEILTGGQYLATPHIIRPPVKAAGYTRTAFAHFMHCHSETRLFPLEKFVNPETALNYGPPVLAGTYGLKTLVDIGLAPKEALGKLGYRQYDRLARARSEG